MGILDQSTKSPFKSKQFNGNLATDQVTDQTLIGIVLGMVRCHMIELQVNPGGKQALHGTLAWSLET